MQPQNANTGDNEHYEVFISLPRQEACEYDIKLIPGWLHIDLVDRISQQPTVVVIVNNEPDMDKAVEVALGARMQIEASGLVRSDELKYVLLWPAPGSSIPKTVTLSQAA